MLPDFQNNNRRDTKAYRAFKAAVIEAAPLCELCCLVPPAIVAHKVQPALGGGLMDKSNVMALCRTCDRLYTRSNPPLRRRPQARNL